MELMRAVPYNELAIEKHNEEVVMMELGKKIKQLRFRAGMTRTGSD